MLGTVHLKGYLENHGISTVPPFGRFYFKECNSHKTQEITYL